MIDRAIIKAAALCMYILTYTVWPIAWKGCFYQGLAVAICLHWFSSLLPIRYHEFNRRISIAGALCAINNLLDELFFDPKSFQVNEYMLLFLIALIILRGKRVQTI